MTTWSEVAELSFDQFERWVSGGGWKALQSPPAPRAGDRAAWVKKTLEHGVHVTSGVSERHRMLDAKRTLCLAELPSPSHLLPSMGPPSKRACKRCEALNRLGVTSLEEAVALAVKSVA